MPNLTTGCAMKTLDWIVLTMSFILLYDQIVDGLLMPAPSQRCSKTEKRRSMRAKRMA